MITLEPDALSAVSRADAEVTRVGVAEPPPVTPAAKPKADDLYALEPANADNEITLITRHNSPTIKPRFIK